MNANVCMLKSSHETLATWSLHDPLKDGSTTPLFWVMTLFEGHDSRYSYIASWA